MADVYLFQAETQPADVRLREAGAPGPVTHTVNASAVAVCDASTAAVVVPGTPPPPVVTGRGGPPVWPARQPVPPRQHQIYANAIAKGTAETASIADLSGRRNAEEELLLARMA